MKKILILTAGFDDDHHSTARNLRDALEIKDPCARVEILDLFSNSNEAFTSLLQRTRQSLTQYAPLLWSGWRSRPDENVLLERKAAGFSQLQARLEKAFLLAQPDCVLSTSPIYGQLIDKIFKNHRKRPFRLVTVVMEILAANPAWNRSSSDYFFVPNESVAESLKKNGVSVSSIGISGFPVNPVFAGTRKDLTAPGKNGLRRILYLVHSGKKKTGKAVERLLGNPLAQVTVVAGREPHLRAKLLERFEGQKSRVEILGWTNQLAELLRNHHLVIGKAGHVVHEAAAACCPIIVNHAETAQEEANAQWVRNSAIGEVVDKNREAAEMVERAFDHDSARWMDWQRNLKKASRPDAALQVADWVLKEADRDKAIIFDQAASPAQERVMRATPRQPGAQPQMLLCDFHIHSNYSDGSMSVPELIDFYGERGFDCICITDHLADPRRLLGKLSELTNLTLGANQVEEYFRVIERERERAWRRYEMLVMTGIEFNKDGLTSKTSAHLLGIDLKSPINPALDLPETIARIHEQGGLAVASHPHVMKSEWGKNTLYLWENQEQFAPLLDAWEIANRDNIFNDIGLKRLPFIANSDLHKPRHIYSWKTLIHCEKDPEVIKQCIRRNEHVAITLYRDFSSSRAFPEPHAFTAPAAARRQSGSSLLMAAAN